VISGNAYCYSAASRLRECGPIPRYIVGTELPLLVRQNHHVGQHIEGDFGAPTRDSRHGRDKPILWVIIGFRRGRFTPVEG
jgi:hypothetical protein